MGFFDNLPSAVPDEPRPAGRRRKRPETEFAQAAASGLLLARTDEIAVAVTAVWAYRDGFEFWLKARFRQGDALLEGPYDPVVRRVEVDGQLIRDAAERSILLWPAASNQPPEGS